MPEIKNTFLAGKMNKSLDDRIVPQGEYRDALNVQVTKAEGPDVGVIHNIEGNSIVASLGVGSSFDVIGSFFDEKNNIIYWFVTNNSTDHRIYKWDKSTSTHTLIVSGSFLNFNSDYKITGVNLLENLLFWTDGLNQPRRIDVTKTANNYYNSEIKVSVAKYAPYLCPQITAVEDDPAIKSQKLEEEFVRFAYRYKFANNEYSILSPFTPIVFEMEDNTIDTTSNYYNTSDVKEIGASTEMPLMVNKVNKVTMNIPLPTGATGAKEDYEIESIDILYKESDSVAIRIIETIDVGASENSGSKQYIYKSSNFKSTLPEDQLTRVYDAVPVKAVAQEIAGNRVVYGNITLKKDLPNIDFAVSYDNKVTTNAAVSQQSVKQRRTYEVGIVLSDIFGRTSPVITSDSSTIYVGAKDRSFDNTNYSGSSLNIIFKTISDPNGTLYNASTNPTGWYSYKVVIKQKEQEYYNVYTPGVWNYGLFKSYFTIHGDNINKVPRETIGDSDTVDESNLFTPSQVRVYPKVLNVFENSVNTYRNSDFDLLDVINIGKASDHKALQGTSKIYEGSSDHFIGQISNVLGTSYGNFVRGGDFAVFETEPFESTLDIYFETPTGDLISNIDLNQFDIDSANPIEFDAGLSSVFADEDLQARDRITNLYGRKSGGGHLPGSMLYFQILSETNGLGNTTNNFGVRFNSGESQWSLYLVNGVDYSPTSSANARTLNMQVNFLGSTYTKNLTVNINNVKPTVFPSAQLTTYNTNGTASGTAGVADADSIIFKIYGSAGGRGNNRKQNLDFVLDSVVMLDGTAFPNPPGNYIEIIDNTDFDEDTQTTISKDGVALVNHYNAIPNNLGHHNNTYEIKFKAVEDPLVYGVGSYMESDVVSAKVHFVDAAALSSSDSGFELYYAPPETFENAYQACEDPLNGNWSEVVVYYPGTDAVTNYPFVEPNYDSNPQVLAKRMYYDSRLSRPALPGWYKKPEERLIGFYYIDGNEPETFNGWWYGTPLVCGSFSRQDAEDAVTYNPPDEVNYEEDDGTNPYDLPDFNPKPQP